MTNIKHFFAFGSMAALVALSCTCLAQEDDLDKLLGELEGDSAKVEKKADDKAKAKDEGEEKKSADKKTEEKKVEAKDEEKKVEGKVEEKKAEAKAEEKKEEVAKEESKEDKKVEAKAEEKKEEVKAEEKKEEVAKEESKEDKKAEAKAEEKKEEVAEAEEVEEEKKPEKKAEEKKDEVAEAEEVEEEKKPEKKAEEKKEEVAEAEEVEEEKKPEKKTEEKKEEVAEAEEVEEEKKPEAKTEKKEEAKADDKTKAEEPKVEPKPAAAAVPKAGADDSDEELISNLRQTEELRRKALDAQAVYEVNAARDCMLKEHFEEAVQHYNYAKKYLSDNPKMAKLKRECEQGIADGLYRWAKQEDILGRRAEALKLMEQARDYRHPKATRQLEKWLAEDDPYHKRVSADEVSHRQNDEDYKEEREKIRKHLRRARQCLAVRDMKRALEECEIVLAAAPANQEALRLRGAIQRKRQTIMEQQREQAREGMIADVDEAWRPVYAVNAAQLDEPAAETVKEAAGEDPERTLEQDIEDRMKKMRLPAISFKPPTTIIEAIDFFRTASKDFDRPDLPVEKRGFNFVLKTPQGAIKQQAAAQEDTEGGEGFGEGEKEADASQPTNGLDPIPTITASDITFYDALKLVCESVDYKFIVKGPVVMVMQKDMSTAELLSRKYDVLDAFLERMTAASSDVKEMQSAGFGGGNKKKAEEGEENQEKDWKAFFEQMGVKWPEGSSIMYIKTLGKLYVRNTRENLAEFEKVLQEMGSQPKLIEIETRFVEVSQEDLNSLGFEWILNSDYSLNLSGVSDKFIKSGVFGSQSGSSQSSISSSSGSSGKGSYSGVYNNGSLSELWGGSVLSEGSESVSQSYDLTRTIPVTPKGESWITNPGGDSNLGINAFGGTDSTYGNGNRYLSTTGNHISGEAASTNDQFMRVNAFLGEADLSMILHMLSQRSDTDLLSAPKVVTKSGENAVIKVVTEYIYPQDYNVQLQSSSSSSGSSSSGGSQSAILAVVEPQNFTMREQGVILDVTPTYSEANGGTIDLELKPQVVDEPTWMNYGMKIPFTGNTSSGNVLDIGGIFTGLSTALESINATLSAADREAMSKAVTTSAMSAVQNLSTSSSDNMTWYEAPMKQPFFHVRSIDSKVSITPGSTVVMGGLITEQRKAMDDKIPFLGDLPYIGRLFRSHAEQTVKRNLLIFVTGRLITPSGRELHTGEQTVGNEEAEVKAAPKAE